LAYLLLSLLRYHLRDTDFTPEKALSELVTMYKVNLRDDQHRFRLWRTVPLTKKSRTDPQSPRQVTSEGPSVVYIIEVEFRLLYRQEKYEPTIPSRILHRNFRPPDIARFFGQNPGLRTPGVRTNTCPVF
jgi:hypothetical protein